MWKIQKKIHHRFSWSRDLWIYHGIQNWLRKKWVIAIRIFRTIMKLGFKCCNWVKLKISKWVFSHEFLLAHRFHNIFHIQIWMRRNHFMKCSPITIRQWLRVGEESQEDSSKFLSAWNDQKYSAWILRFKENSH